MEGDRMRNWNVDAGTATALPNTSVEGIEQ